ncbi:hypothetical protein KFE25_007400 [Diacronema lutheri]|uniref:sn-1-specific diacylglycerol lipase n=2 Tax=Diacronema lutheri TaxID=2081491 RepID=A0A8J5XUR5_DIALT|nr:hypothetical protein KFE25_007400 [Diacronema lutheri]
MAAGNDRRMDGLVSMLLETQELDMLGALFTGRWGASSWSPSPPAEHDAPPAGREWRPVAGEGTDADGWRYATSLRRLGAPRDGGRGVQRPTDKARWREWQLVDAAAHTAGCDGCACADGDDEPREMVGAFLRLMAGTLWQSSRFSHLPPDLVAPARLRAKHEAAYEATFRALLARPGGAAGAPRSGEAPGWARAQAADAPLLGEAVRAMVHARAAFGYAALRGHFASVGRALGGFALSGGYKHVDAEAHTTALCALTGLQPSDVRLRRWGATALLPAHYVAIDRSAGWIVVSVRGTHSAADVLTDLHAAAHPFALCATACAASAGARDPGGCDAFGKADARPDGRVRGSVHAGMLASARALLRSVTPAVAQLRAEEPHAGVVVVGHSLGAGTAALLAALMRDPAADVCPLVAQPPQPPLSGPPPPADGGAPACAAAGAAGGAAIPDWASRAASACAARTEQSEPPRAAAQPPPALPLAPDACAFCMSPPAMAELATARLLGAFVTSVIVGADVVPRLCAANALQLSAEMEDESAYAAIAQSQAWRIAHDGLRGAARALSAMRERAAAARRATDSAAGAPCAAPAAAAAGEAAAIETASLLRAGQAAPEPALATNAAVRGGLDARAESDGADGQPTAEWAPVLPSELRRGGAGHHFPPGRIIHLCDRRPRRAARTHASSTDAITVAMAAEASADLLVPMDSAPQLARDETLNAAQPVLIATATALATDGGSASGAGANTSAHGAQAHSAPGTPVVGVALVEPALYSKILLMPDEMLSDHLPDRVLELLERAHSAALRRAN